MNTNPSLPRTACSKKIAGRSKAAHAPRLLPLLLLLSLPTLVQAQFLLATNNGTITITGYTGPAGAVAIPAATNGLPVTAIGNSAFSNRGIITSITIPNSVTSIGTNAFYSCTGLTNLTVGASVTNIGDYAFYSCTKLTNIALPNGINYIAGHAFEKCTKLKSVIVPNGVTDIGTRAFSGCSALTSVLIPEGVISLGSYAFGSSGLTNVSIPNGVTSIGDGTFTHCVSLTSATIPASVTSIGKWVFESCDSLISIAVDELNAFYCSVDGVFFNESQTILLQYPAKKVESDYTMLKAVTNIGDYAFVACKNLKGIYFQGNAPSLGLVVFSGTYNATVYYLPSTTDWGATYGGRPTALWQPQIQTSDANFGVRTNQFGFNIAWASGQVVVVEASETWPIRSGRRCKPTPSAATRSISAIPCGPIIPADSTACARREAWALLRNAAERGCVKDQPQQFRKNMRLEFT